MNEEYALWQCDAYKKTIRQVCDEFCQNYWDKPRKRTKLTAIHPRPDVSFKLQSGIRTYICRYVIDKNNKPIYKIFS